MKKRILILGGTSFIAGKFIEKYQNLFDIELISRRQLDYQKNYVFKNFFELQDNIFEGIDIVINFAAIVHQPKLKEEGPYKKINYELPLFLAKKAYENKCRHFVQISTINVYGEAKKINDDTPCKPTNFYGKYKLKADIELKKMDAEDFVITCLRPSMVYGDAKAPGNMNLLIKLVKTRFPLPFKRIDNQRNFLNIDNLTAALKGIIDQGLGGAIILADEYAISTSALIDLIAKKLGKKNLQFKLPLFWKLVKFVKPNLVQKLTGNLVIENTFSFKELGVDPIVSIETGIEKMLAKTN